MNLEFFNPYHVAEVMKLKMINNGGSKGGDVSPSVPKGTKGNVPIVPISP